MATLPKPNSAVTEFLLPIPGLLRDISKTLLSLEADCWDVHAAITGANPVVMNRKSFEVSLVTLGAKIRFNRSLLL